MTSRQKARRQELLQRKSGLVRIEGVALMLGVSVATARAYKNLGIIDPYTTNGRADLFDLDEIKWALSRLRALKSGRPLRQIGDLIQSERIGRREQTPIEYEEPLDENIISWDSEE